MICSFHSLQAAEICLLQAAGTTCRSRACGNRGVSMGQADDWGRPAASYYLRLIRTDYAMDDHYHYVPACTGSRWGRGRLRRVFADHRLWPTFPISTGELSDEIVTEGRIAVARGCCARHRPGRLWIGTTETAPSTSATETTTNRNPPNQPSRTPTRRSPTTSKRTTWLGSPVRRVIPLPTMNLPVPPGCTSTSSTHRKGPTAR